MILTADWHLVDDPREEYRWGVFKNMFDLCKSTGDNLYILGDLCDRADRHRAALVNRIVREFQPFRDNKIDVTILMGNHDIPISGEPYWNILNNLYGIRFLWKPDVVKVGGKWIALLPYSAKPAEDWKEFTKYKWQGIHRVFMHQPVDGVLTENGTRYETPERLPLPTDIPIYSGDIHTPQTIGNITYVGAPHVVKFGDMYRCRALQVFNGTDRIRKYFFNNPHRKWMLRGSSVDDIKASNDVQKGHQAKVEFTLPIAEVEKWPGIQTDLRQWANDVGFDLVSMEAIITLGETTAVEAARVFDNNAEALREFAKAEGISGKLLRVGLSILTEVEQDNGG